MFPTVSPVWYLVVRHVPVHLRRQADGVMLVIADWMVTQEGS